MTRLRCALALSAALGLAASRAEAQMLVYDATSYGKLVQQATTALDQLHQLETQVSQGQQLLQSLNQTSNVAALAPELESAGLRRLLPDAQALATATSSGDLRQLGALGAQATAVRDANRIYSPPAGDVAGAALDQAGLRAARDLVLGQSIVAGGAARLTGLETLQQAINIAPTARAVFDLQARTTSEQAMTANDQMRLQGLAMMQAAEDRLATQREKERIAADSAARLAFYRRGFR